MFRSDTNLEMPAEVVIQGEDSTVENMAGLKDKYALSN